LKQHAAHSSLKHKGKTDNFCQMCQVLPEIVIPKGQDSRIETHCTKTWLKLTSTLHWLGKGLSLCIASMS